MPNSAPTDSGLLSVVLPAFNEEEMAPRAADVISALLEQAQIPHELLFVDDGSRDRTWARIQEKSRALPQVRGVRFSRNFGKEAAIFAGLAQARGACCVCWTATSSTRRKKSWTCTACGSRATRSWKASR